jgi:hypothetical protein
VVSAPPAAAQSYWSPVEGVLSRSAIYGSRECLTGRCGNPTIDLSVMARRGWDQSRFAELRARRDSAASHRAYDAMFCFLSGDDLKRAREWDLFVRFCEASKLDIDPAEVDMLDPPWPDLKADVFGHSHYFELGEVVQQDWMKAQAQQERKLIIDSRLPLTAVWSPLASIVQKKATKKYAQQASPLSLLLYAERNAPHWAVIEPLVRKRKHEIRASFENSVFDHLWLFMANENRIPLSLSRKVIGAPLL